MQSPPRRPRSRPSVGRSACIPSKLFCRITARPPTAADPQLLGDSDTLSSRGITSGAAIHLFQRPKTAAYVPSNDGTPGLDTVSVEQAGALHDIPPLLLQFQERGVSAGPSPAEGYLDANWEVDGQRRGIRFLSSFLLLISIMQVRDGDGTRLARSTTRVCRVFCITSRVLLGIVLCVLALRRGSLGSKHSLKGAGVKKSSV